MTNQTMMMTAGLCAALTMTACDGFEDEGPGCTNTCVDAFDGYCDDGGPDSDYSICSYGTDCADCGARRTTSGTGEGSEPGDGFEPEPEPRPSRQACVYTYRSRTACPGVPNSISGPTERCAMVESLSECRQRFKSDTDCFSSCCTRTTISGHQLRSGGC